MIVVPAVAIVGTLGLGVFRHHVTRVGAVGLVVEADVLADGRGLHAVVETAAFLVIEGLEFVEPPVVATGDVGWVVIFDFGATVLLVTNLREVDTVGVATHNKLENDRAFRAYRRPILV